MKIIKWYIRYFTYVIRHKYFVACACFKMWLYRQWIVHDLSKFRPSEARWYMRYYSLNDANLLNEGAMKIKFDLAWNYHQKRNKHHWQYWVLIENSWATIALDMPEKYIKEMLCDRWWVGRSFAENLSEYRQDYWHKVRSWYLSNYNMMLLSHKTREYVDSFLLPGIN